MKGKRKRKGKAKGVVESVHSAVLCCVELVSVAVSWPWALCVNRVAGCAPVAARSEFC